MRSLCIDAAKQQLPKKLADALEIDKFSGDIRVVADKFVRLQQLRHLADYDPLFRITKSDADLAVEWAVIAIVHFNEADETDRRNFLLCMVLPVR